MDGLDRADELAFASRLLAGLVRQEAVPVSFQSLRPIPRSPETEVADGSFNSVVLDTAGHPCAVLMVSNSQYPDSVRLQISNTRRMWQAMGAELGRRILRPSTEGFEEGRSFAVWPLRRPPSRNRLLLGMQKRLVAGPVLSWLRRVAIETRIELPISEVERKFLHPLREMHEAADLDPAARQLAREALDGLESGRWDPLGVISHNDLWMGNVLFNGGRVQSLIAPTRFSIIDWGGCYRRGFPLYDAFYFGQSIGLSPWILRRALVSHCNRLAIPLGQVAWYICAAVGAQGARPDCFPRPRFVELSGRTAAGLRQLGFA